jgi:hypothetical protein
MGVGAEMVDATLFFSRLAKGSPEKRNSLFWRVWSAFWKDFLQREQKVLFCYVGIKEAATSAAVATAAAMHHHTRG